MIFIFLSCVIDVQSAGLPVVCRAIVTPPPDSAVLAVNHAVRDARQRIKQHTTKMQIINLEPELTSYKEAEPPGTVGVLRLKSQVSWVVAAVMAE